MEPWEGDSWRGNGCGYNHGMGAAGRGGHCLSTAKQWGHHTPSAGPAVAARAGVQPGLRQHVHQDLVGPHRLHQEGGEEGEAEGEGGGPEEGGGDCRGAVLTLCATVPPKADPGAVEAVCHRGAAGGAGRGDADHLADRGPPAPHH